MEAALPSKSLSRIEVGLALVDPRSVDPALAGAQATGGHGRPTRLHFGSEFCEALLPQEGQLRHALAQAAAGGLALALVTPILSDAGMDRLRRLLALLTPGSEVVANDWGVLRLLHRERPDLTPVAGRMICKMIKDPRLPSAEWAKLYPHGIHSGPFGQVLDRLGVRRLELDVPPFADIADFRSDRFKVSVHAPYGFSVKGRACRIGSLRQSEADKFATGHSCHKECLTFVGELSRPELGGNDLPTFQRGNTVFYRHSAAMSEAVAAALAEGWIDRIIVSGDWHEAGRAV